VPSESLSIQDSVPSKIRMLIHSRGVHQDILGFSIIPFRNALLYTLLDNF